MPLKVIYAAALLFFALFTLGCITCKSNKNCPQTKAVPEGRCVQADPSCRR